VANLHLLGTGATVSDPHRTTTMLALEGERSLVVIDCGSDVVQRIVASGLDPDRIEALIVTHEHADHVSGFPLMMERLWLYGRRRPLDVYGIAPAISQAQRVHDAFDTSTWPDYPGCRYHEVAHTTRAPVLTDDDWHIVASPSRHSVPSVALRIEHRESGRVLAYSCDTAFSQEVIDLSVGADLLVHEATGVGPGHANALEAAEVAARAEVGRLLLVHLPPEAHLDRAAMGAACARFPATEKGAEGGRYPL
jgi:ribonuclease Z